MSTILRPGLRAWVAAFAIALTLSAAVHAEPLPPTLTAEGRPALPTRGWSFKDIIEVTRIDGTAVDDAGRSAAFILKQPSVQTDDVRYALYVSSMAGAGANKLTEAAFLGDLSWRPKVGGWTIRGDFGDGVQLYMIDSDGPRRPLVVRSTVGVGGQEGIISSGDEPLRQTGVISYGWNSDGSALWYLCAAPSPPGTPDDETQGIVYDPELSVAADFSTPTHVGRLELHVLEIASRQDRVVDAWPGRRGLGERVFQPGRVRWNGANRLIYAMPWVGPGGLAERTLTFDRSAGLSTTPTADDLQAFAPTAVGADTLSLEKAPSGAWRLSDVEATGRVRLDLGEVDFIAMSGWLGAWRSNDGRALFGVMGSEKLGLFSYPRSDGGEKLAAAAASLSHCSFDVALANGVCAEESQTEPPRLVEVSPMTGAVRPLANPNLRYADIAPLRIEKFGWVNANGHHDWGWVTYPRGYRAGERYPAIVITHASDARNTFADPAFQWSFPLQVLAERGYLVISANERLVDAQAAPAGWGGDDGGLPVKRVQAAFGLEAVANMEAAAKVWVDRGVADPKRMGIAGYSRGAIVTTLTLSQSRSFRAGIAADTNFYSANGYWEGAQVHRIYLNLFGGSPFDPKAIANYRAFSPSLRATRFSGPLLQLFTGYSAPNALQLDRALRDAKVPTELVSYVGETHVFHRPLAQLSAMVRSLGWFDDKLSVARGSATYSGATP